MSRIELLVPQPGTLAPNDQDDPLPYYYHPLWGPLFRHRLQMGLDLIPERGERVLEVGTGSGILVGTLTRRFRAYTGTDLVLAPNLDKLVEPGCQAEFRQVDLLGEADLPANAFDVAVCFSVLEHIHDSDTAARNLARALVPGGTLVCGYPMVGRLMSGLFATIGFRTIDDHHVSPPRKIEAALRTHLDPIATRAFPPGAGVNLALYRCSSWRKRA